MLLSDYSAYSGRRGVYCLQSEAHRGQKDFTAVVVVADIHLSFHWREQNQLLWKVTSYLVQILNMQPCVPFWINSTIQSYSWDYAKVCLLGFDAILSGIFTDVRSIYGVEEQSMEE
jgi:hypothetical protein